MDFILNNTSDFKETFEIIDLANCHGHQNKSFEKWPQNHSTVAIFVNGAMNSISNFHVFLLVFCSCKFQFLFISKRTRKYISITTLCMWTTFVRLACISKEVCCWLKRDKRCVFVVSFLVFSSFYIERFCQDLE